MKPNVLVLGDSLAGLVTAWRLSLADFRVTLLKLDDTPHKATLSLFSTKQRQSLNSTFEEDTNRFMCDPSEPIIFQGPCPHTESLWKELGESLPTLNWNPVSLESQTASAIAHFSQPWLPAPLNTIWGISTFSAFTYRQRWHLLSFLEKVWEGQAELPSSLDLQTMDSWLNKIGQTDDIQKHLWSPLCRYLLGTNLNQTLAGSFTDILARIFFRSRHHRPRVAQIPQLSMLLKRTLSQRLEQQDATIMDTIAIKNLRWSMDKIIEVCASNGNPFSADWYIAAISPQKLSSIIPERLLARYSFFNQVTNTNQIPIVKFRVLFEDTVKNSRLILHDEKFSWTLCHPLRLSKGTATLASHVSAGDINFLKEPDEQIKTSALETLYRIFPNRSFDYHYHSIVRDPWGFVPRTQGTEFSRPPNQSPIPNFLLAGSWTDTEALTEFESAIESGDRCAEVIIQQSRKLG